MEILAILFGVIICMTLAFIIANAGARRNIGFGWSLFLGIWLSPIVSLIAVLLSEKIKPNEFGAIEKKWGCLAPMLISSVLILIPIFFFYSYKEKQKAIVEQYQEVVPPVINSKPQIADVERTVKIVPQKKKVQVEMEPPKIEIKEEPIDLSSKNEEEERKEAEARRRAEYERLLKLEANKNQAETTQSINTGIGTSNLSFNVTGRSAKYLPRPVFNEAFEDGIIIVDIEVNPEGKVVNAKINTKTSISNTSTQQSCLDVALKTEFSYLDVAKNQSGSISYHCRLN